MKIEEHSLELFADYFQIYLQDEDAEGDLSNGWTASDVDNLLALTDGTIGVGTARNMTVPVCIQIFNSAPDIEQISGIDQINECDIALNSGRLVVSGCTDYLPEALRINLEKGIYRARIYYLNLDTLREDGLEGDDSYIIQLWKVSETKGLKIIRKRKASA
ncbi:hypothetical protein WJR50_33805 [Catalinimonas sp. 4WD22]|uniref:hypothetical protein n=1 Tax=Catalinimonas locisalis TaxID=3133978 RepID=UPI003101496C